MHRQVLFLSIDGLTDPLGQSQILPYQAGLAKKGYQITIISCEKKENLARNEAAVRAILNEAGIKWKYCLYSKKIPLLSQRGNMARLKKLAIAEAKNANGPLIAHCRSYLPALAGLYLKNKFGARFIFDMRGFWADERVEGGIWKTRNPLHKSAYRFFKRKEKEMIAKADHVVTLSEQSKKIILSWKLCSATSISTIPCCVDIGHFVPKNEPEKKHWRQQLGIDANAFVFGYLGSLGTWYMLDEMLEFFKLILLDDPKAVFAFITPDRPEMIYKAAQKHDIAKKNIVVRAASRNEVPGCISTFNAGLFFIRPTFSKKASSPTKMAEILACGVPVITNTGIGDCDAIIKETHCGILVSEFSIAGYRAALDQLDTIRNDVKYLRSVSEKYFSLDDGISHYANIYKQLIGRDKAKR